jgi:hypothetical protein
LRINR